MSPKRGGLGQGASALFQPSELLAGRRAVSARCAFLK